jgi:hypothetical protein
MYLTAENSDSYSFRFDKIPFRTVGGTLISALFGANVLARALTFLW